MSVARFIADQKTFHRVPHAKTCRWLAVSPSWFYKWHDRPPTPRATARTELDGAVRAAFEASGRTYGSPRVYAELRAAGWRVGVNTVAASMAAQGLVGRKPRRCRGLTRRDRRVIPFTDLLNRDFTATRPNARWIGDITEIPTDEGKLYLATVLDLFGRRLLAAPIGEHPDAALAGDAIRVAIARRGGRDNIRGVIFHTDRGSTYTAERFTALCRGAGIRQSMGRVGSCFDNAAAESFFSTLEHEVLSRHRFTTKAQARAVITPWCEEFYNKTRRHSAAGMMSPIDYENAATVIPTAA